MATDTDLAATVAELRRLLEKATPGPWWTDHEHTVYGEAQETVICHELCEGGWMSGADGDLIVALRNAAPALLDALAAATAERDELQKRNDDAFELLDQYQQGRRKIPGDDLVDQAIAILRSEDEPIDAALAPEPEGTTDGE